MPALGLAVRGEVLERRHDARLVVERRVALKAAHGGDAHARDEVGIFAERLLDAAPARIARDVDDRRQRLVRAAHARLLGSHCVERFDERRVERRGEPDRLRKARARPGAA